MSDVLTEFGVETSQFASSDPGEIVFQDKHQVIVLHKRRSKHRLIKRFSCSKPFKLRGTQNN